MLLWEDISMKHRALGIIGFIVALGIAALACGPLGSSAGAPPISGTVAPITIGPDLTQIDVCAAVPVSIMEGAIGRKLSGPPTRFDFYGAAGASGCMFDGGKDANKQAYYGYVVLTPAAEYDNQPLYQNKDVAGIGDEAYLNNGADTRQLWVRFKDKVAFVVGVGDIGPDDTLITVGKLVAAAIK
jgi:hypothetical protein